MIEPEAISENVSVAPSWTPSYATTVQGSSPRLEFETALKDDPEPAQREPSASDDVPATTEDVEPVSAPAEPVAAKEVPEPAVGTSLDEAPTLEGEAEVSETPKIVTPADEESVDPAATTETTWTRSYSVTSQPGSPRVSPKAGLKELEPEPQPVESTQETPAPPIVEPGDVPRTIVTSAAEDEDDHVTEPAPEEESKPAWTQSYSVTSQPGSPRVSPKQIPEEIPGIEEVKPSWTRSYSVTSQPGSPRIPPKEDMPEPTLEPVAVADEPATVVTPLVEEPASTPAEVEATERPKSPWTPSYSVTTLEGQTEQAPPEDVVPVTDTPISEPLGVKAEQPERPKSPWTPSYSVTTVTGSVPVEEPEPHPVADKPSVDLETPAPEPVGSAKAVEEHSKGNGITSDVFEVHEAVAQFHQADLKPHEPAPPQLDPVSLTRHYQMICCILTGIFSPSRMLPTKLGRNSPGLLRTQSRTFGRRGRSFWPLKIFQQLTNPPRRKPNLLSPTMRTQKVLLLIAP